MEEDFDDFDFDIIDQIETNYAASKQQQNVPPVSAPPTAAWQPAQQKQPTGQQQQQHWNQNIDQRWDQPHPVQQMQQQQHAKQPSWQADKQPAGYNSNTRLSKPFVEHNAQQQTCMQQQTAGSILNQQQQFNWQQQRGTDGQQTVQGVWQPSSRQHQQYQPSAKHADTFQQKNMHSTNQQQQQPALYQLHSQQQQQWPSHAVDHQQQQQQQESTMARLMQAPHSTHLSTAQAQATAAAHKASNSRPIAAVSASAAGAHKTAGNKSGGGSSTSQLSGRANTRPVVHQDNTMLPYQQQPAMQQRKHARQQQQQQGKGKLSVPQSGQQPGIQNFFQIDQQKQQQRDIQRLQQQQAAQQQQEIEMQQQQHQRSRPAGTGIHLQHDEVVIDVTSDDDLTLMQDESPVAQQAARQQPWAVPHHQQRQIPQQQQQQQPDPCSVRPQQQQQQQVRQLAKQVISDPLAVQQLLSMAYPGTGKEGSTLCCPSQVLSHCPASTMMKGEEAPARRINKEAAKTWLYPSGSVREYQYQIAYTAIRHNTLACLPTGLGKTFIAAVVMYNFYRWFPRAKIAFVAPTRPLVDQQLVECLNIMGFHKDDVAKLLGIGAQKRRQLWETKRIFFSTPQTLENDLKNGACASSELVCLVVDECHRATGDHAMANIVKIMRKTNEKFRVLALSATPGNNHAAIQEVIRNMMIHKVDFRSEDDASISPYCHQRTVETVLVPVSQEGKWVTHQLLNLMHPLVMALNTKCQAGLMVPNERHLLSSHTVMEARRKSQITSEFSSTTAAGRGNIGSSTTAGMRPAWAKRSGSSSSGSSDLSYQLAVEWEALSIVARIADAFELKGAASALDEILLVQQIADGVRAAAAAAAVAGGLFASGNQKTGKLSAAALGRLRAHSAYNDLVERLKALAASPHPKLEHLGQQLQQHFAQQQQGDTAEGAANNTPDVTRAIVFCSFRDQVAMLAQYLRQYEPDIIARPFVGQGNSTKKGASKGASSSGSSRREAAAAADGEADQVDDDADGGHSALVGMKQNEQKKVLDEFRAGEINVLLATCIGEEGLDIPQVDLIVCWDSGGNPSRARQRMGRTGRSRPGRVVYLLSEGREHEKYEENLAKERQVKEYLRYADQRFELCNKEVPLLPADVTPTATLITVPSAATATKAGPAGRGSKCKAPTAAEEPAAAAGSRKRAATRQQAAHPAVAAADNAPLGMGYAALKRARTSKNKPKVVEDDDDDGWESDQPDQQQQQQQQQHWRQQQQQPGGVWQPGSNKPAQTTGAIARGSSVELPLQADAGRGSCGPDTWSHQIEPDQSATAAARSHCGTIPHQQHQQCEQPVCWCESDDEDNADVPLAQRLAAKQQQHTVTPGPVSIAVSSDTDVDQPLVTRLAKKQQQQQQQQQQQGELAGHAVVGPGSQQADLTLAERQQQLLQQQQALVKKPVKKLVSKKKRLAAAAAPNAAAAVVLSSAAAPSPQYQDSKTISPSAAVSAADLPAEQPGLVWEELDDYADLFDRDEWLLPTKQQQRQRQQQNAQAAAALARLKPNTQPPVADLSHFTVDQQVLQGHDDQDQGVGRTAEGGQPMQLFSFHTAADARPVMTMHANAAAVLLPPNSWATQQMLQMCQQQQQQQGEYENAASMCECIPETPLSAAGTLSAAAASGGRSSSRPQSSCPPPPAAAAAADSVTKVLAGLLDHLMQPMSTAELQVAAAAADGELSGHRLAGLALLQAHQVTDDHEHDGDLLLTNYNTQRRAAAAAAAAIDRMQTAEQNAGQDQQAVKSTAAATVASDGGDHNGENDDLRLVQNEHDLKIDDSSDLDEDDQATVCVPWRVKPKGPSAATAAAVGSEGNTAVDVLDVSFKDAAAQPNQPATAPASVAAAVVNPGKQGSGIAVNKGKKRSTKRQQQQQQTGSQSDILGDLPLALLPAALPAVDGAAAAKPRRQRKKKLDQQQRSFKQQQPDSQGDVIGSLPLALLPAALPAAAATARAAGAAAQKGDRSAGSGSQQQQRRDRAQGMTAVVKPPIAAAAAAAEIAGGDDSECKPCQQHWSVPAPADLAVGPGKTSPAAADDDDGHNGDDTDSWLAQSETELEAAAAAAAAVVNAQQQQPTQQESLNGQQQQQQVPALTAAAADAAKEENVQADSQPLMAVEGLQYLHQQQADISQQPGRQCGPLGVADHATADASIQAAKQRRMQSAAAASPRGAAAAADADHIGEADHHDAADPDPDPNTWDDLGNTAAAAATTGVRVPNSHHHRQQQQQQQQPVWQQPSWRSLAGVGKNRSKALRKQQQLVASSWDEVCTQQEQQQQGRAAAAVSAAVRPASGWDDFWTQPDPQEADAAAESQHESQGEDAAAADHHHQEEGTAQDPPGSSPQQQQQQVTSGLSAPAADGADDAVDAGMCADDDLHPQQICDDDGVLLPDQACEQDPVLMQEYQQQQQQQRDVEDGALPQMGQEQQNGQVHCDQAGLMSPPPMRTPHSAAAAAAVPKPRRASFSSAAKQQHQGAAMHQQPAVPGGSASRSAAAAAAAGKNLGRCTWEADDLDHDLCVDLDLRLAGSSSKAAKPPAPVPLAAAAGSGRCMTSPYVLNRRHSSSTSGGGGVSGVGFKTPGSDDAGLAAAGFKRRRRRGGNAILMTQQPADNDDLDHAANQAAVAAAADLISHDGHEEGLTSRHGDGKAALKQQQEGRLRRRLHQHNAPAAGTPARPKQRHTTAAGRLRSNALQDGARKKPRLDAAAAAATAKHKVKGCVFIDEAAADSDESGDHDDDLDEDEDHDLSGFIATDATTPSAATDRSTPGISAYHRTLMTQTPVGSDGKVDIWALLHGKNRARPERYQKSSKQPQQQQQQRRGQHGERQAAAHDAGGGWHNARSKPQQQQQQYRSGYLLESPDDDLNHDEPAGLTLADTPSDHYGSGDLDHDDGLDEYETEDDDDHDGGSGSDHDLSDDQNYHDLDDAGEEESQPQRQQQQRQIAAAPREDSGQQQQQQQRKPRQRHQVLDDSDSEDTELAAAARQQTARLTCHSKHQGRQPVGAAAAGGGKHPVVCQGHRGKAKEVICLDSSESCSSSGKEDSDSDDMIQQRRQQPAAAAVGRCPHGTRAVGRRQAVVSDSSDDDIDDDHHHQHQQQQQQQSKSHKRASRSTHHPHHTADADKQNDDADLDHDGGDDHFDECAVCCEGGELLMCDRLGCQLSYHLICAGLRKVPQGDWYCPACREDMGLRNKLD